MPEFGSCCHRSLDQQDVNLDGREVKVLRETWVLTGSAYICRSCGESGDVDIVHVTMKASRGVPDWPVDFRALQCHQRYAIKVAAYELARREMGNA